ncbi:hypothetical protein OPQ81_009118 [Rhizoctonia solani]|nr:hypothetical protein OPQ81_009118 [Rhizoctonia solani]
MAFLKSYSWALRTFQALRAQGMLQTLKPHRSGFPNISRQQSRKIHPYTPNRQDHCCRTNEHRRQKCTDRFYLIAWTQAVYQGALVPRFDIGGRAAQSKMVRIQHTAKQ